MSTAVLQYGANERRAVMLEKLGGRSVLQKAIDVFYTKQMKDMRLLKFFEGVDMEILKWHQFNLMSIAFTAVPANLNVVHMVLFRHERLFDKGLNEDYYDIVMEHFKTTLEELQVDPTLVEEALEVVMPLRHIFVQGARDARERKRVKRRNQLMTQGALLLVVVGFVAAGVIRIIKSKKR